MNTTSAPGKCEKCEQPIESVATILRPSQWVACDPGLIYYDDLAEGEELVTRVGQIVKKQSGKQMPEEWIGMRRHRCP